MDKLIKLYFEPNVTGGNGVVTPVVPVTLPAEPVVPAVPVDTIPKTKEDWQKLAQDNPQKWIELTQPRMDQAIRESRELKEQLERERREKENYAQELNRFKQPAPVVPAGQQYTLDNPPKTQADWDALFIESPKYASDLNQALNARQTSINNDFQRAFSNAAREVQGEHPDMYVLEVDTTGQPLKDGQGKLVIKKDQNGLPIFNPQSEKGKLWEQIYQDSRRSDGTNPLDAAPNAPILMMAELERRLVKKGQSVIEAKTPPRQNQVLTDGVPPPAKATTVKFNDDAERLRAEKAVASGVYKSLEQFCEIRDNGIQPIYDQNRRPDFSRRN